MKQTLKSLYTKVSHIYSLGTPHTLESINMAKSKNGKINKAAAIREVFGQSPDMTIKEVIHALAEKGIKVSYNQVYFIRAKNRQEKRKQKREKAERYSQKLGMSNPVEVVLKVKSLAREIGGIRNLKQLVDALAD
jgi:hypothetical protein